MFEKKQIRTIDMDWSERLFYYFVKKVDVRHKSWSEIVLSFALDHTIFLIIGSAFSWVSTKIFDSIPATSHPLLFIFLFLLMACLLALILLFLFLSVTLHAGRLIIKLFDSVGWSDSILGKDFGFLTFGVLRRGRTFQYASYFRPKIRSIPTK